MMTWHTHLYNKKNDEGAGIKVIWEEDFLPENGGVVAGGEYSGESSGECSNGSGGSVDCDRCVDVSRGKQADEDQEGELCETTEQNEDQSTNPSSESDDNPKTENDDVLSENHSNTENEQTDSTNDEAKTLKKPDKIVPAPLQQHGHQILLLQQLQRQPATSLLQELSEVLDQRWHDEERSGGGRPSKEQKLRLPLSSHYDLRSPPGKWINSSREI
ncbi:hypothetical protein DH2020_048308 [Rehmannia glutinosa]|uniref:Uncharacterized protein n=1 Tax=Rehmannia glutinosa TaxID=99300 RepID=A0ABR0U707_REHGL